MPAPPIKASTQEHLNIEDIQDDLVLLKDGSCSLVLQVTAINFGLLSEAEQDAIIYAYAGLLNSLTFPIEILIRSKKKDISSYLALLDERQQKIKKPALKEQLKKYRAFVEETVQKNEVLDKKFYIAIPFSTLELGISSTLAQTIKPKKGLPFPKSHILEKAKTNLFPKRDHLIKQLSRLGLKSQQLNTQQLLELFYNIYNPQSVGQTFVASKDYKVGLVQPAISGKEPEKRKEPTMADNQTTTAPTGANQPAPNQAGATSTTSQPKRDGPPPATSPTTPPPAQKTTQPTQTGGQPARNATHSVAGGPTKPTPTPTAGQAPKPAGQTPPIVKDESVGPIPSPSPISQSQPSPTPEPAKPVADGQAQAKINQAAGQIGSKPKTEPAGTPTTPPQSPAAPGEITTPETTAGSK